MNTETYFQVRCSSPTMQPGTLVPCKRMSIRNRHREADYEDLLVANVRTLLILQET